MNLIIKQLDNLVEQKLYSNVAKMCEMLRSNSDQKPELFPFPLKYQLAIFHADALYHTQQFSKAETLYREALQIRKSILNKNKNNKLPADSQINLHLNNTCSDAELKYRIHLCCMALKQTKQAMEMLLLISSRQRTPKVNMSLGNLYKELGHERYAITCFREVLKECPLALEAAENLLKLGVKGVEVSSMIVEVSTDISWFGTWIKAQAQLQNRDFTSALATFQSMNVHGVLKDSTSLLVNIAYCHTYLCDDAKAITVLQKAIQLDSQLVFGRDLLSTLLAKSALKGNKEHERYLETLVPTTDVAIWTSVDWTVLGNYMYAIKKHERATYFGQQACVLNISVEAYLLKANSLFQAKFYQEAASHCTDGLKLCPFRYDLHKCLLDCLVENNRFREAESMAVHACKLLNYTAHAYMLHASVLLKDPSAQLKTIRKILEKAVALDKSGTTNALCNLVEYIPPRCEVAFQLLQKMVEKEPSSRLHQVLGDCCMNMSKDEEAFHHYTLAVKLDPTNQRATEGLNVIGVNSSALSKRDSYYITGESSYTPQGTIASDHEGDPESDSDPWPTGNESRNFD